MKNLGITTKMKLEKKPKLNSFVANCPIVMAIKLRPSHFALHKLKEREYIKLSYFTPEGCAEAVTNNHAVAEEAFAFSIAKINLLQCMEETGWPKDHILALATFYLNFENHPKHQEPDGDAVLLAYQAQVHREWHIEVKSTTGDPAFDISIINDDLVEKISIKMWNRMKMLLVTRLVFPLLLGRFATLIICFHLFSATHCMCYPPPPLVRATLSHTTHVMCIPLPIPLFSHPPLS